MEDKPYQIIKSRILGNVKRYIYKFSMKQWNDLMINFQDLMLENIPKPKMYKTRSRPELNPDIKKFVDETNRRLRNE